MGSMSMSASGDLESGRGAGSGYGGFLRTTAHPKTAFFHVFFKAAALFTYLFCGFATSSFILSFILVVLFLVFDFWTVKNITGRLMVGLRWWNKINDDGTSEWVYESLDDTSQIGKADSWIFWGALTVTPLVWVLLCVVAALTFKVRSRGGRTERRRQEGSRKEGKRCSLCKVGNAM